LPNGIENAAMDQIAMTERFAAQIVALYERKLPKAAS
jgi:hypothetical protein